MHSRIRHIEINIEIGGTGGGANTSNKSGRLFFKTQVPFLSCGVPRQSRRDELEEYDNDENDCEKDDEDKDKDTDGNEDEAHDENEQSTRTKTTKTRTPH